MMDKDQMHIEARNEQHKINQPTHEPHIKSTEQVKYIHII